MKKLLFHDMPLSHPMLHYNFMVAFRLNQHAPVYGFEQQQSVSINYMLSYQQPLCTAGDETVTTTGLHTRFNETESMRSAFIVFSSEYEIWNLTTMSVKHRVHWLNFVTCYIPYKFGYQIYASLSAHLLLYAYILKLQ